jgi:hypothetical protein
MADDSTNLPRPEYARWQELMRVAFIAMTAEERLELEKWENANLDGYSVTTSDWPGWEERIGIAPWKRSR